MRPPYLHALIIRLLGAALFAGVCVPRVGAQAADGTLCNYDLTAKRLGKGDCYLLELRVWYERDDGIKAIVSAPQIMVVEGKEGVIHIGANREKGRFARFRGKVTDVKGKKTATAVYESFVDGVLFLRKELVVECKSDDE